MRDGSDQCSSNAQDSDDQNRNEFTPLHSTTFDTNTLRLIISFFFGFSITVSIALGIQIYYGNPLESQVILHGSVVSDSDQCSNVGTAIMKQGGNGVDAIIAVAFCMGVVNPHLTGLGSGGFMLVYDQRERKLLNAIDFRVTRSNHSSIGIPGFVAGLQLAHQLHGVLPWKQLVLPAEFIAKTGYRVSPTLMKAKSYLNTTVLHNENLQKMLKPLTRDAVVSNLALSDTLLEIATSGSAGFYDSILANELRGTLDTKDVTSYKAFKSSGMKGSFLHYDVIVPGEGSGGPLLLNNLKLINNSMSPLVSAVDGFKLVAAGWPASSGSNIAVMDGNDMYVTMTSGLGSILGSKILTNSGFILNNILLTTKDTSQRPEVLLTPVITLQLNKICGRRLLFGAGDVRDVVQALVYLLRDKSADIAESIEAPRVRNLNFEIYIDESRPISSNDTNDLEREDFSIHNVSSIFPSINVLEKINDTLKAHADSRGAGYAVIF